MASEEATGRTDLSELVRTRLEELGMSARALADASVDPKDPEFGPQWKRGTLTNLINEVGVKPPTLPQLRGLAAGLRLPLGRLQEAAGSQFFGIDTVWSDEEDVRVLVHDFRDMSPEDQARLRAIMQSWRSLKND